MEGIERADVKERKTAFLCNIVTKRGREDAGAFMCG